VPAPGPNLVAHRTTECSA